MKVQDVPESVVMRDHRGKTITLLPLRTPEREQAEAVRQLRQQGVTMRRISEGSNLSVATLRRMLTRLAITEMVEEGVFDREIRKAAGPAKTLPLPKAHVERRGLAKAS